MVREIKIPSKLYFGTLWFLGAAIFVTIAFFSWEWHRLGQAADRQKAELQNWRKELGAFPGGPEVKEVVVELQEVADAAWVEGDLEEAIHSHGKRWVLATRFLGEEHWMAKDARWTFGLMRRAVSFSTAEMERLRSAEETAVEIRAMGQGGWKANVVQEAQGAVAETARLLGPDHPRHGASLHALGYAYYLVREYEKAREKFEEAFRLRFEALGEQHPDSAASLHYIGMMYFQVGKLAEAEPIMDEALEIRRAVFGDHHVETAESLFHLSFIYKSQDLLKKAERNVQTVWRFVQEEYSPDHQYYAYCLRELGDLHFLMGRYQEAEKALLQAIEIQKKTFGDQHPWLTDPMRILGDLYFDTGRNEKGRKVFEASLEILLAEEKSSRSLADAYAQLAGFYTDSGDLEEAVRLYLQALRILDERNADLTAIYTQSQLGLLYRRLGRSEEGLRYLELAQENRRRRYGEVSLPTAWGLHNLGVFYHLNSEFEEGERYLLQAIENARSVKEVEERSTEVLLLISLGDLYSDRGSYGRAMEYFQQALSLRKELRGDDHPTLAWILSRMGDLHYHAEDLDRAEPLYTQARDLIETHWGTAHPWYAETLFDLAALASVRNQDAAAVELLEEATEIRRQNFGERSPSYAYSLARLAQEQMFQGQNEAAAELYQRSLKILEAAEGKGAPGYAFRLADAAWAAWQANEAERAEAMLREVITLLEELNPNYQTLGLVMFVLAEVLEELNHQEEAQHWYQRAMDHLERRAALTFSFLSEERQLNFVRGHQRRLGAFLSLLLRTEQHERAYEVVLAWKGLVFRQQRKLRQLRQEPANASLFTQWEKVARRVGTLSFSTSVPSDELERLTAELEAIEVELARRSKIYAQETQEASVVRGGIADSLDSSTALIDFFVFRRTSLASEEGESRRPSEDRVAAFLLTRKGLQAFELCAERELSEAIQGWREAHIESTTSTPADLQAAGEALRSLIWAPLEPSLEEFSKVLISPDGAVARLPFAALPIENGTRYLIEEKALATIPIAQLLPSIVALPRGGAASPSLLVAGGIDYDRSTVDQEAIPSASAAQEVVATAGVRRDAALDRGAVSWPTLEGARQESLEITQLFEKRFGRTPTRLGRGLGAGSASEGVFRTAAPQHHYLHLATHGFFAAEGTRSVLENSDSTSTQLGPVATEKKVLGFHPGLLSGIVFAGANDREGTGKRGADDGILTATEVAMLDLRQADLVVLSACETGLGRVAGGEGVLGLQRAFQLAGAARVIASTWKVDDAATRALVTRFYTYLWNSNLPAVEALRRAQLDLLSGSHFQPTRQRGKGTVSNFDPSSLSGERAPGERLPPYFWAAFALSGDWR